MPYKANTTWFSVVDIRTGAEVELTTSATAAAAALVPGTHYDTGKNKAEATTKAMQGACRFRAIFKEYDTDDYGCDV